MPALAARSATYFALGESFNTNFDCQRFESKPTLSLPHFLSHSLNSPPQLPMHQINLLRQHPWTIKLIHKHLKQLNAVILLKLWIAQDGVKLAICACLMAEGVLGAEEGEHGLVVPGLGDVVVSLDGAVDDALDGVAGVVDEDDGGREAVADYGAEFL
jgi:hypothetical protein